MRNLASAFLISSFILAACGGGSTGNVSGGTVSSSNSTGTGAGGSTSTSTGTGGTGGGAAWTTPACTMVTGTAAVTFTRDEGKTLAPTDGMLTGIGYTYGLVALDTPNVLLAEHQGTVLRSEDAGCTWSSIGTVSGGPFTLAAAQGGRAYAFQDNASPLYRIEGTTITELASPASSVLGVGTAPLDGATVRLGDANGMLWESKDAGATWVKRGSPAPVGATPLVYRFAFDPKDIDHVIVGAAQAGALTTADGGMTWKAATGLAAHGVNVFSVVFSPQDGKIVWAQGIDLDHTGDAVSEGRTIWRSEDGGLTFAAVTQQTASVTIRNQELLAAHPTNPSVLYFVFGTYFQQYGTDIYRYDHQTGIVTTTHNHYDDVSAIAFSPADPSVMYLGLTADAPSGP